MWQRPLMTSRMTCLPFSRRFGRQGDPEIEVACLKWMENYFDWKVRVEGRWSEDTEAMCREDVVRYFLTFANKSNWSRAGRRKTFCVAKKCCGRFTVQVKVYWPLVINLARIFAPSDIHAGSQECMLVHLQIVTFSGRLTKLIFKRRENTILSF